jgi:hypothetical protein
MLFAENSIATTTINIENSYRFLWNRSILGNDTMLTDRTSPPAVPGGVEMKNEAPQANSGVTNRKEEKGLFDDLVNNTEERTIDKVFENLLSMKVIFSNREVLRPHARLPATAWRFNSVPKSLSPPQGESPSNILIYGRPTAPRRWKA